MPFSDVDRSPRSDLLVDYLDRAAVRTAPLRALFRELLGAGPGDVVLDLGCGAGHDLVDLAASGAVAVGMDSSWVMVGQSRDRAAATGAKAVPVLGAGSALPFAPGAFHGCLASRVLQHVGDPETVIAEVRRVLRPGARLVVFDADWGSMTVDSDDDEAVAAFTASVAGAVPQRRIGLTLRRLLVQAGFARVDCGVSVTCCTSVEDLRRLASPEAALARAVETGLLTRDHAHRWLAAMTARSEEGTFWATLSRIVAVAQA